MITDGRSPMNRTRYRWILRATAITLAWAMAWTSRFTLDPDGMSYIDIARAYLNRDWHNALSSYWSPLYPWLLTVAFGFFHPSPAWLIPATHFVVLGLFAVTLAAWEWLLHEWEKTHGPPAHWFLADTAAYLLILWTALDLGGVDFNSADDAVIAGLIAVAALLIRIRRLAKQRDYVFLALVLAAGFFAKAAFQTIIPAVLLIVFLKDRRAAYLTTSIAVLAISLYVIPMSVAKGRVTVNDTGRLNYAWQVTGYGVEGYKEEGHPAPANIPHPIDRLVDSPRVLSFAKHMTGTTPIHFDPVWWCEGYPLYIDWARQWSIVKDNIPEMFSEFLPNPALAFALLVLPFGRRRVAWFIWLPAVCMMAAYILVYVLSRYTCAPFTLFGFTLLAAGWHTRLPKWMIRLAPVVVMAVGIYALETELYAMRDWLTHAPADDAYMVDVYNRMKREGFQPEDRAGMIGMALSVQFLQLLQGREVATVPARIYQRDGETGRPLAFAWEAPDAFWRADPASKQRVYDAMRSVGAKWVFASQVPAQADTAGWTPLSLEKNLRIEDTKGRLYFRKLVN